MATVSRVARGQLNVDAGIRIRVRKAAAELGLDLDQRRNDKSAIIAFLLSNRDVLHSFQAHILLGAELTVRPRASGTSVHVTTLFAERTTEGIASATNTEPADAPCER